MTTDFAQSRAMLSLRETMKGQTLLPSDHGYHRARQVWNGAVDRYPAALALCETVEDVQAAVHAARANRMALSVRGGGHDWAGRAQVPQHKGNM
jgi:FAD/FMN-containing dehydrogenase